MWENYKSDYKHNSKSMNQTYTELLIYHHQWCLKLNFQNWEFFFPSIAVTLIVDQGPNQQKYRPDLSKVEVIILHKDLYGWTGSNNNMRNPSVKSWRLLSPNHVLNWKLPHIVLECSLHEILCGVDLVEVEVYVDFGKKGSGSTWREGNRQEYVLGKNTGWGIIPHPGKRPEKD